MAQSPLASFTLRRWAAWAPQRPDAAAWLAWANGATDAAELHTPAVAAMAPMLRRRLAPFGRMALECAYGLGAHEGQSIVFASRHGELGRCLSLLEELQVSGAVSPQGFSVAVHNAVAGLYTIDRKLPAPVSAVAGGLDSYAAGLIEASALLADGAPEVWLLVCEEALPPAFAAFAEHPRETDCAYAYALALGPGSDWQLHRERATDAVQEDEIPALQALRALLRDESATLRGGWQLSRGAAA